MTTTRCHTYQGVHIPGCYGCALHGEGPHSVWCSCPPRTTRGPEPDPETAIERRMGRLERKLDALVALMEGKAP